MVDRTSQHEVVTRARENDDYRNDYERRTQVIEDQNAEQRLTVSRLASLIWLLFGILEALIGLRVVLKLLAANAANPFASLVYNTTYLFLWPFQGLIPTPSVEGIVLEISSIIAMFVYAIVGWILVRLVWLLFYHPSSRTIRTTESEHEHLIE